MFHAGMLCVLLVMLLELLLIPLGASGDVGVLIEDAYDAGGDFGVEGGPVVLAHDIDAEFLLWLIRTSKHLAGLE